METKRWTFTELKAYFEDEEDEKAKEDRTVPSHWPPDLEVDAKRHPWLPDDWGQGLKRSSVTDRKRTVFISPEGKLYENRRSIEKALGRTLEDIKDTDKAKRREQIAASEAPPQTHWPGWLPLDWTVSTKLSSGVLRTYYHSPSGRGFFNRGAAEEYIQKSPGATAVKPPSASVPAGTSPSRSRQKASDAKDGKAKRKDAAESPTSTSQADPAASPTLPDSQNESTQAGSEGSPTPKDSSPSSAQQASQDAPAQADAKNGSAASQEESPRAGAEPAEDSGSAAAAADAAEPPPAKRQRLDGGATDEEVEQIQDGESGDGFASHRCRAGAAWLVLPDDVISLDLKAIGGQVEAAGWNCVARNEQRWDFTGSPDLVLYPSGKLLVRSAESEDLRRIARQYVDEWLSLEA